MGTGVLPGVDVSLLMCPDCGHEELRLNDARLVCSRCTRSYRIESGQLYFTDDYFDVDNWESRSIDFDPLQRPAAKYFQIDRIIGPRIRDLREYLDVRDGVALNLGSGRDNYAGYVNVDLGRYSNVHIVTSLDQIPYRDSSVDLLVTNSVLEHVYDYQSVINEIYRILKPGGFLYICVPNVCMRHHQYDFHRWTMPGLLRLLHQFDIVEHGPCRGLAYAVSPLIESLIVAKTRPGIIREACRRLWLFASLPLYWFDGSNSPEYEAMSQTIYVIAKKPA